MCQLKTGQHITAKRKAEKAIQAVRGSVLLATCTTPNHSWIKRCSKQRLLKTNPHPTMPPFPIAHLWHHATAPSRHDASDTMLSPFMSCGHRA
jgi:hypothetical protein